MEILASENACDGRCRDEEAPDLNVNLECLPECEFPWCFDHFFNRGVMLFSMGVSPAAVLGRATRLGAAWGTGRGEGGSAPAGDANSKRREESGGCLSCWVLVIRTNHWTLKMVKKPNSYVVWKLKIQ